MDTLKTNESTLTVPEKTLPGNKLLYFRLYTSTTKATGTAYAYVFPVPNISTSVTIVTET
jgi:hypothetical protein